MHRTTSLLLWMALSMPLAGAIYFCGVLAGVPIAWIIAYTIAIAVGLGFWINKLTALDPAPLFTKRMGFLLLAGIACLAITTAFLSRRYGDWDAALIWNLHARYLSTGEGWRGIYDQGASGNAAYPLGLPSTIALAWRTLTTHSPTVPFFIALLPTLGIPIVIFLESAGTKLWLGAAVLALFGLHRYYLALGLDQYADIQVAWFWLLAAVCIHRAQVSEQKGYWAAAGLLLGALCWTKWESLLLTACLLVPHAVRLIRQPRAILFLIIGSLPFLLTIILFVRTGPPRAPLLNDLAGIADRFTDSERYRIIASAFIKEATGWHCPLAILLTVTPLLWRRYASATSRRLYASVVAAIVGYMAVYLLLVSTDLDWNLQFSLPRLLLQVYPVVVFAAACACTSPKRRYTLR